MSPTKNPTVTLAGVSYELKYGPAAEYQASVLGVDIGHFLRSAAERTPHAFADFLRMFSAMVAPQFLRQRQPIPTPDQWALVIEEEQEKNPDIVAQIAQAVIAVLMPKLQASARTVKLQEPTPVTELPPLQ